MTTRAVVVVAVLGLFAAAAAVVAAATSDHSTGIPATIALAVPTGLAYIGGGLVARRRRPRNGTGALMILVGFAWFIAALPSANDDRVFTLGLALNGLFIGFLGHLFLAYPSGKLGSRADRVITGALYLVVAILPTVALILDDGDFFNEVACERPPCPENVLASGPSSDAALVVFLVYALGAAALSLAVAVRLLRRWRRASPALRTALNPILVTAGALIAGFAVQVAVSLVSSDAARVINWFVLTAMLAVPLAFLYGLLRPRLTASVRRLSAELSEQRQPEQVQDVLRRALRDPSLQLGLPGRDGYVDVDGDALELPDPASERAATPIGDGVIVHDASLLDQPELDEVLDAVRIALERGVSLRSLAASKRRVDALLDAIPDNVFRVAADGTFIDVIMRKTPQNPEGLVYPQGITAKSLIGRKVEEITPALSDVIYAGIRRALETDEVVTIEHSIETPFGVQHAEERIIRSGPDEVVGLSRDVTERKRQEEALRVLAEEQAALTRVAVAVATEERPEDLFNVVTEEVGRLFGAEWASTVRYDETAEEVVVVGEWHAADDFELELGYRFAPRGGAITEVKRTGRPARIDYQLDPDPGQRHMVAAPIVVGGRLWGATTISVRGPDTFPSDAEERLGKFANLVAVAVSNAEAREQVAGLVAEQAALSRVAVAVAASRDPQTVFDVVTAEVGKLFAGAGGLLVRYSDDPNTAVVAGTWESEEHSHLNKGEVIRLEAPTPIALVRRTGSTARVDSFDDMTGGTPAAIRALGIRSECAAPVVVGGRRWGAIIVTSLAPAAFDDAAEQRLAKFANLVALAIANTEAHEELTASRARIVRAGDEERQRLERNLHDGAQQRLVALSLELRLAQSKLDDTSPARPMLEAASDELAQALEELRELARGIHPAILSDRGLAPALEALAARAPVPVELDELKCGKLPADVEAAAYYVVSESLTNVAKYAGASAARVRVERRNGLAIVEVADDGVGGADPSRGSGLRGLADRVEALDGRLSVSSAAGSGTTVRAEIPLD